MNKQILVMAFVGALAISSYPTKASAASGIVTSAERLPEKARAALSIEIETAKRERPRSFQAVGQLRQDLPMLDTQKRGRFAAIAPMLKPLGKEALLPMLEELAFRGKPQGTLTDSAWIAWRAGVIEAVGMLRDPRAEPVLVAILDGAETEYHVVHAAAAALGRLGTDAAVSKLVAMAKVAGVKQKAVFAGMGECRRTSIATALSSAAALATDAELARVIAHSLGDVGSAWAWQTPVIAASGEEAPTRAIAAKALVDMFIVHEDSVRKMVSNALLVVDDSSTPGLIEAAKKGASPELAAKLDALTQRFARNPIHTQR